jgi:hypothetical protein
VRWTSSTLQPDPVSYVFSLSYCTVALGQCSALENRRREMLLADGSDPITMLRRTRGEGIPLKRCIPLGTLVLCTLKIKTTLKRPPKGMALENMSDARPDSRASFIVGRTSDTAVSGALTMRAEETPNGAPVPSENVLHRLKRDVRRRVETLCFGSHACTRGMSQLLQAAKVAHRLHAEFRNGVLRGERVTAAVVTAVNVKGERGRQRASGGPSPRRRR